MKRLIFAIAILFGCASVAWAAAPPDPLTTLQAVSALSNAAASRGLPASFEATVTYFPGYDNLLFVQDGDLAIFVLATTDAKLLPGDRVLIKGTTQSSFHPIVISKNVTLLRHGAMPKSVPATFDELIRGKYDCMRVIVRAVIRTADLRVTSTENVRLIYLQMLTDGGYIEATVDSDDASALKGLLDAEVEVTGIAGGKFDDKMQQTGVNLHISSLADVKILKRAVLSPQSIPVTPIDQILAGYHVQDETQRVRVHGTITYYQPGLAVVLQDGAKSLWIDTPMRSPLRIGDVADATGFPQAQNGFLTLTHGEIEDSLVQGPIPPLTATWRQLAFWSANQPGGHQYDLVSIEGQVVTEVRGGAQDEYVLSSDGQLFSAIYRHPDPGIQLSPMMRIPLGSRIRVTGICMIVDTNPYNISEEVPFNILLRSFGDIKIVAGPSLLNIRNLILVVCVLLLVVFAVLARAWSVERKVRRQTAALASLEQRRSHILENINGSRPLAEIVEEIAELVSFKLDGAPCWCQITDGARLGNCPRNLAALRVIHHEIPARTGAPLGRLFAAFDPLTKSGASEMEALSMGAGVATLAIETRRLYSDLLHRSEFDLLTDIHNRFSLAKHLDTQIEEARRNAGIFGLVYIDLDEFKQVNDLYGHRIGDLYLQEVAVRMKQQLRSHDLLARLGGDEFAALLPKVRNRADVEEIAQRLEHCFNDPFVLEEYRLQGSASFGIALYPEDSDTRDGLLSTADAAMYTVKNSRKQAAGTAGGGAEAAPADENRT